MLLLIRSRRSVLKKILHGSANRFVVNEARVNDWILPELFKKHIEEVTKSLPGMVEDRIWVL